MNQMWLSTHSQNQKRGDGLFTQNPVPPFLPPRSSPVNLMSQRKVGFSLFTDLDEGYSIALHD
jgi:hypothetical protein